MKYDLSICIPTYNRRECLKELLDSIIDQVDSLAPVEICVGDDASTDDTPSFINEYQKKYPYIVYYRFPENAGIDNNILKTVSISHGDYCWLMGNDDKVEQGAIELITRLTKEYKDSPLFNVNGWQYDSQLRKRVYHRVSKGLKKGTLQNNQLFDNLEDILLYFGDSFGFLGDNVFNRSRWNEIVSCHDLSQYNGSHYIHLAVFLLMLQRNPSLLYIHQRCWEYRSNNDGFLEILGQADRLKFDVVGYNQIASGIFSNKSHLYKIWMSQVIKMHIRNRVIGVKLNQTDSPVREIAWLIYSHFGRLPAFWIYVLPILLVPRPILFALRALYRVTIKRRQQSHQSES
ncbi:MAG: glycosyltransferase family 2 protein [Deltaproteobacteria bacterium]|nr:glycosyltransferase family 2 protein [Deltaproteobacteria bacterium]